MSFVISSFLPFPPISFWAHTAGHSSLVWDDEEPFRKMTYRNRYYIAGGNGMIMLSIPLVQGRSQHTPMNQVLISDRENWQVRHWRTLVSAYARSPYFGFYEADLKVLFETPFRQLADFSLASVHWVKARLGVDFSETNIKVDELKMGQPDWDLRRMIPKSLKDGKDFPFYQQVFVERIGFLPDLSILDLLFAEGPHAAPWLLQNREQLLNRAC